jgi:endonuclease/exonuclease/phosphatase family metal-dependent hydrolase
MTLLVVGCQNLRHSAGPDLAAKPEGALRVAAYNVYYILMNESEGRWSVGHWERREDPLDVAFKAIDADIIAFQEMESFDGGDDDSINLTRQWLLENNPDYAVAAIGDWRTFPSTQPVFYRPDRFEVVDQGWFFYSETPDVIYSRTFDGYYPAFTSWVQFGDRPDSAVFRIVNVHFDYASSEHRRRSKELVAERAGPWVAADETLFHTGDLKWASRLSTA